MLRTRLAFAGILLATTMVLPAQWNEAGDAGDLPATAQVPGIPTALLPSIIGTLSAGSDVDMYLIQITDPATFSATTVGGATFDTQLWLFHPDGRGVSFNDDSTGLQSTVSGAFVGYAGLYYLAVSAYDRDAGASGAAMWNDTPFGAERRPDGPRRGEAVDSWGGAGGGSGAYTITLAGCERPRKQVVAPDNHHLADRRRSCSAVAAPPGGAGPAAGSRSSTTRATSPTPA